ncbi:MAG TPA: class I SAM-dependent methyltransferase [Gaiellaceae bacterium]|nr:class I SAM-dependent methyltransferase [Gaiellaceae bacterium]
MAEIASEHVVAPQPPCRLCGSALTHTFVDLGMSPLCESYVSEEDLDKAEPFYPLHVRICAECLLVQLAAYVPGEEIFRDYAYFSAYSDSWVEHARRYADMISERLALDGRSLVVELASNDGYLLQHFVRAGIPSLGVDPAANVADAARARGVETIVDFFDSRLARQLVADGRAADLVVANNVLAQVPELNDFVAGIEIVLAPHGVATVEVPHLARLIEGLQFDTIYHEHYSYFSLTTLVRLASEHGLEAFDVEELPSHGGSLRVYLKRRGDERHPLQPSLPRVLEAERLRRYDRLEGYAGFAERVAEAKWRLLELLIELRREGKQVVGYGAPGKGNTLLNYCGIRTDLLDYTVDRNPYKQGKYLPGTRIPIYPPEAIARTRPDVILVLPWNLRREIASQLAYVREWGARLVVPIPRPEVLEWEA